MMLWNRPISLQLTLKVHKNLGIQARLSLTPPPLTPTRFWVNQAMCRRQGRTQIWLDVDAVFPLKGALKPPRGSSVVCNGICHAVTFLINASSRLPLNVTKFNTYSRKMKYINKPAIRYAVSTPGKVGMTTPESSRKYVFWEILSEFPFQC